MGVFWGKNMEGAIHSFSAACPSLGHRKTKPTSPHQPPPSSSGGGGAEAFPSWLRHSLASVSPLSFDMPKSPHLRGGSSRVSDSVISGLSIWGRTFVLSPSWMTKLLTSSRSGLDTLQSKLLFLCLYQQSHSFSHYQKAMAIDESGNIDWLVN